MRDSGRWLMASLVAAILFAAGFRSIQAQRDGQQPGIDSVFLEIDSVAAKKLAAARDLLSARQWGDGIDLVRQIADQHHERLVGISPGRYVSVQAYCDILLSGLPAEGLKLYRQRTDPQARRWFESARAARDEEGLQKVLRRAYLSSFGDDALQLLGELAWEGGRLELARRYWEQLLPAEPAANSGKLPELLRYPDPDRSPVQVRAQLILCSLVAGDHVRAQRELEALRALHAEAKGQLAGRSGNIVEILAGLEAEIQPAPHSTAVEESPTFAGDPKRNVALPEAVDVGSVQWSVTLNAPPVKPAVPVFEFRDRLMRADRNIASENLSCYPVTYGNLIFYCDETAVYARELISARGGGPAWGDDALIYRPAELQGRAPGESLRQRAGLPRNTISIDRGRLYARLGSAGTRGGHPALRGPENMLVCLDLEREGDLAWMLKADRIEPGANDWSFDGAPLAAGGRVYVALRRSDPQLQLNVACLDANSGHVLWNRRVCLGLDAFGPEVEELRHQLLTLADERLFYNTNLGAVAALDARDGEIQWVASYPRAEFESRSAFTRRQVHGPNPCMIHNGHVYAAPWDCDSVLSFHAESGVLEWSRELKGNVHQLVGTDSGRLIAAGDMLWGLDTETGRVAWFTGQSAPEAVTHGRAAIAGGHVYWPRREEILMVETAGGRVRRQIDLKNQHGIPGGGNITLAEGGLILAQAYRLSFFSEYGRLRKTREDQLSQRPSDPFAHLELARVAEALHDWPLALASYEHVGHASDDRQKVLGQTLPELAVDRRAKIHTEQNAPAQAIAEWQTLLDPGEHATVPAAAQLQQRARHEISRLLATHGDAAREPFERAAEEEIQEAVRRRDLHALRRAIVRNVHSRSVSRGRLALADLQHAAGEFRSADESRSAVLRSESRGEMRAVALAGMALSAEDRGHWSSAARLWQSLYDCEPLVPIRVGTLQERAIDVVPRRLQAIRERERGMEALRSDPIIRQWECALRDGEKPLIVEGASPASVLGCVLVSGPDVICRSTADGQERWRLPVAEPVHWAGFSGGVLVLGSRAGLMAVAPDDGTVVWHQRLSTLEGSPAMARDVSFHAIDDRVYCLATDVGLSCFSSARGDVCWSAECRWPAIPRAWHCGKNWIAVPSPGLDGWLIWNTLDADLSGSVARAAGGQSSSPVVVGDWLGLSDDRARPRVVKLGNGTLSAASYQGPLFNDAGDAQFVSGETALVAMFEGTTLVRVDPSSGKPLWSCRSGPTSPGLLRPAVCLDDRRVHSISCGIARSVSLDDGQFLWERRIGSAQEEWRVERTGPWLALVPTNSEKSGRLTLCDPATGELVARIPCGGRSASARLVAENDRFVLATDSHLTGYRRLADGDE